MQHADCNIGELLTDLVARFHRTRQSGIDEKLFDVVAGFVAMAPQSVPHARPGGLIHDLFDLVTDRLESLTFEITTRNQQTVNRLGFWLTTSFGAIETGFVAASIATWYYPSELGAVVAWTIGVALVTALGIAALLRWTMNP